jgi:rhodanese-related sulfurtransferase
LVPVPVEEVQMVKSVAAMLREARASVGLESAANVADELAATTAVVIDVRQHDEYLTGHIPGSIPVPRGLLEFIADPASPRHVPELQPERRIVVVSASGARAALAAATLQSMGYPEVVVLEGGIAAWLADGRQVSRREYQLT